MLAVFEAVFGHGIVQIVRGTDVNQIDILPGNDISVIPGVKGNIQPGRGFSGSLFRTPRNGRQFRQIRISSNSLRMYRTNKTGSDNSNP